ncbi:PAS domain-containing sensor histidine kinase [Arenibacter latericius]|uniref:PAS domain-containing sensor histidine kinase n=1 Tax=Arenibacter latericius TaxID=86104 RepID=UPI00042133C4|nr:PAS domain S-box protein [Arenibacter latericius]MDX1363737.1 PAS domain S-box protein [Arenibacter latericius]
MSIKATPVAIAILDENLVFTKFSDLWFDELRIKQKDITGKSFFDVVPNSPKIFLETLESCLEKPELSIVELQHIDASGKGYWYQWRINQNTNEEGNPNGLIITVSNITKLKQTSKLLKAAENITRLGGWELDLITGSVYWSRITKEIHEVPEDYSPSLETSINFYKEGESRDKITSLVDLAINKEEPWDTELKIITAKGKEIWVRAQGTPEFINGKCVRLYGLFQDIDETKKLTLKDEKNTEKLRIATTAANVGIWELNCQQNTLDWNDQMFSLYGIKKSDFNNHYETWENFIHPDDLSRCQQELKLTLEESYPYKTQFRVVHPNGNIRYIKAFAALYKDDAGNNLKLVGTNWDITELINTQLKLDSNQQSFRGSFESSAVGMALVSTDGSWLEVNQSLSNSLGYTPEELLKLSFQDITLPEDLDEDLAHMEEVIAGKKNSYQIEKRYIHKNGKIVHVILTVTAVRTPSNDISHFISQILDITERIEADKKTTELLNITKNQNNSLTNFAHIVSHNLRSHSSNLTMLTQYITEEEDEAERKNIENMLIAATEGLNETVSHLNEVVQISLGAKKNLHKINLLKAITSVRNNINVLLKEKNVLCEINVKEDIEVLAIPAYIDSVLLNLFTNSIKYSSPDRQPKINITTLQNDDHIIIEFSDNGLGIDLKRHGKKLFGMYKTFHKHNDSKGIGLFISKNQIEAMGGTITAESTVGEGTSFKITLRSPQTY